jgi:hypothetical protein
MNIEDFLQMWVVYNNPSDYPGKWVVRLYLVGRGGASVPAGAVVADTLEGVRAAIPPGLQRLERHSADDPVVYEVWV